jgi:hypothetical protein
VPKHRSPLHAIAAQRSAAHEHALLFGPISNLTIDRAWLADIAGQLRVAVHVPALWVKSVACTCCYYWIEEHIPVVVTSL